MKKPSALAVAILFAAIPVIAAAQAPESAEQQDNVRQSAPPRNKSIKQGIKNDAAEVKRSFKEGAANVKRKLAVARCNDGRYSYTHHLTCNHHGGVRQRFR